MNKLRENDPEITRDKAFEAAQQGIAKLQELEDNAKVPRPPIPGPIDKLNPFISKILKHSIKLSKKPYKREGNFIHKV